jgi:hypothetical protein
MHTEKLENTKRDIQLFLDNIYFDFQTVGGPNPFDGTREEYIIRLITRSIVALCTAWWSVREMMDYLQKRSNTYKGFRVDQSTA